MPSERQQRPAGRAPRVCQPAGWPATGPGQWQVPVLPRSGSPIDLIRPGVLRWRSSPPRQGPQPDPRCPASVDPPGAARRRPPGRPPAPRWLIAAGCPANRRIRRSGGLPAATRTGPGGGWWPATQSRPAHCRRPVGQRQRSQPLPEPGPIVQPLWARTGAWVPGWAMGRWWAASPHHWIRCGAPCESVGT